MKVKTIFVTNRDDISVEYLIDKFRFTGRNYLRINSEDIDLFQFEYQPGSSIHCHLDGKEFDLSTVTSAVFKRTPLKFNNPPDDENNAYLNGERRHFLEGLYLSLPRVKWINPMFSTHIAERKLHQLQVAKVLGLTIPPTLISNSRKQALTFLEKHKECIIKPVSNGLQVLKEKSYSIYTTPIDLITFSAMDLEDHFNTPIFIQERISNFADIRVTIVGSQIFCASIKNNSGEADWRKPEITKSYQKIDLPNKLADLLLKLNRHFGLIYSAIDLIQMPDGDFCFLEVNPVGEWVWIEQELGFDISGALINELS